MLPLCCQTVSNVLHRWRSLSVQDLETELYTDMYYIHLLEQALQKVLPKNYQPFSTPIDDDDDFQSAGKGGVAKSKAQWS
jgi:hypothetical protein